MTTFLRAALAALFALAGLALFYALFLMLDVRFANEWATPGLMMQRLGLLAFGTAAIYAAFRVWRGSVAAVAYGGMAVLALILFVAFVYALGEGMRR